MPLTRGQLSRVQQEQKKIRNLYAVAVAIGTLVVLVVGLAVVTTFLIRPNTQVARVNDTSISRATYEKLRRYSVYQTLQNNLLQQQYSGSSSQVSDADLVALRNVADESNLDEATVSQLINDELLRQASVQQFDMKPSEQDLKTYVLKDFAPQPTPPATPEPSPAAPTITSTQSVTVSVTPNTPTPTLTPTVGSPTATPSLTATLPPVPGAEQTAVALYNRYVEALDQSVKPQPGTVFCSVGCPNISESDYLKLIVEPRYRHDKVVDKLAATEVMTQVEQIHVQHILTDTEEGAKAIKEMLDKGADFTKLANTQSKDTAAKNGDLGWTPKEDSSFVPEFTEAAFKVPVGQYSDPVKTQFGWHIIKVLERDPKRALAQDIVERKKTKAYDDWLDKARQAAKIEPAPTPTPAPPTPLVSQPTLPPAVPPTLQTTPGTPEAGGTPTVPGTAPAQATPTQAATSVSTPISVGTPTP